MFTRRLLLESLGAATCAIALGPGHARANAKSAAASSTAQNLPAYDPAAKYDLWTYDITYRRSGNEAWLVRIYQPQGAGPFPVLLEVHGGVWESNDRTLDSLIDRELAASGIVIAAIDFRQAPRDPYPASVADVNYAARWLKVHAKDFNGDPRTLGGLGMSSGGHLVMLSAMRPRDGRYAAIPLAAPAATDATLLYVIGLYPILDPYARYLFAQQTNRPDLVKATNEYFLSVDAMREGNPTLALSRGESVAHPGALILQGTADKNVTPEMQQRFVSAYRAAGGAVDLEIFSDTPHGFTLAQGPATDRAVTLMKAFIARQLGLQATTTQ